MPTADAPIKRTTVILCVGGIISKAKADALGMRVGKNLGLPCYQDETFKNLLQDEWLQQTATIESLLTILRERCTGEARMRSLTDTCNVVIFLDVPEEETVMHQRAIARGRKYGDDVNDISAEYLRLLRSAYSAFMSEVAAASGSGRMVVKVSRDAIAAVNANDLADAISAKCRICQDCRRTMSCLPVCENENLVCNCKQTKFLRTNLDAAISTVAKADPNPASPPSSPANAATASSPPPPFRLPPTATTAISQI